MKMKKIILTKIPFSGGLIVGRLSKRFSLPDLPLESFNLSGN